MKTKNLKHLLLIILLTICVTAHSQDNKRQINQSTIISKIFAVPQNTDMEEITGYDLARMIWEDRTESSEIVINNNNKLIIKSFHHNLPRYEYDYQNSIGMSITDETGTKLFDHNGLELIYEENEVIDDMFTIPNDALADYGFSPLFDVDITDIELFFEELDFTVSVSEEGLLTAINDSVEIYINPESRTYEKRVFSNYILIYSDWAKYHVVNNYTIPLVKVFTTYDKLFNLDRMQISTITTYTHYSIINETGTTIVSYTADPPSGERKGEIGVAQFEEVEKKSADIKVYPNPGKDIVNVELPLFVSTYIDFEIVNTLGEVVYSRRGVEGGSMINLDVSHLRSGIYIFRCGRDGKWKSTKFIKQ